MNVEVESVIDNLGRQVGDMAVRLAVAEARIAAYERAEVDRVAAEESSDAAE